MSVNLLQVVPFPSLPLPRVGVGVGVRDNEVGELPASLKAIYLRLFGVCDDVYNTELSALRRGLIKSRSVSKIRSF